MEGWSRLVDAVQKLMKRESQWNGCALDWISGILNLMITLYGTQLHSNYSSWTDELAVLTATALYIYLRYLCIRLCSDINKTAEIMTTGSWLIARFGGAQSSRSWFDPILIIMDFMLCCPPFSLHFSSTMSEQDIPLSPLNIPNQWSRTPQSIGEDHRGSIVLSLCLCPLSGQDRVFDPLSVQIWAVW